MKTKITAFLAALLMVFTLGVAGASSANAASSKRHEVKCNVYASEPYKITLKDKTHRIKGRGDWYCNHESRADRHWDFANIEVVIQFKHVRKLLPDQWFSIPPGTTFRTDDSEGTAKTRVGCEYGNVYRRTKITMDTYGELGHDRGSDVSPEKFMKCTK